MRNLEGISVPQLVAFKAYFLIADNKPPIRGLLLGAQMVSIVAVILAPSHTTILL